MSKKKISLITPINDGEAQIISELAKKIGLDVRVSFQKWGATLDKEPVENLSNLKKKVYIVEMPDPKTESTLTDQGHEVEIIDHHQYGLSLDRSHKNSSLQQFLNYFDIDDKKLKELCFDPRFVNGVGINDAEYIYGLRENGYSENEIKEIREFDLRAQFKDEYEKAVTRAKEIYKNRNEQNGVIVMYSNPGENFSVATDMVVMNTSSDSIPQILNLNRSNDAEVSFCSFSGPREVVQMIKKEVQSTFGGSAKTDKTSDFLGWINPDKETIQKIEEILNISI